MQHRAWAEINFSNYTHNFNIIKKHIGTKYLAVIKANAYGHGDEAIAKKAEELGVDWFGVATLSEGITLRNNGINKPILIFGYTAPEDARELSEYRLTQALFSHEYAEKISYYAKNGGFTVDCHLKLDTGMGRIGYNTLDRQKLIRDVKNVMSNGINITGVFTHFAVADERDNSSVKFTHEQLQRFLDCCSALNEAGIDTGIKHCANSAAGILYPEARLDMVRVGVAQYGFAPSSELQNILELKPLMSLHATVAMVKTIHRGDTLSYGRHYTATEDRKIATVTIGYADGYPRILGNKARVIINGEYAPVVGRVCMDQLMADVTDIENVEMGDNVILVGSDNGKEITFEELADMTDTVHYERICAISPRVQRIYID